jgi:hypothetical protein
MSGSRQLFGIGLPTVTEMGYGVQSILSAQPVSVSPDGTSALMQVRVSCLTATKSTGTSS